MKIIKIIKEISINSLSVGKLIKIHDFEDLVKLDFENNYCTKQNLLYLSNKIFFVRYIDPINEVIEISTKSDRLGWVIKPFMIKSIIT